MTNDRRVQAGVRAGGQYAAHLRKEANRALLGSTPDEDVAVYVALRGDQLRGFSKNLDRDKDAALSEYCDGALAVYGNAEIQLRDAGIPALRTYIDTVEAETKRHDPTHPWFPVTTNDTSTATEPENTSAGRWAAQAEIRNRFSRSPIEPLDEPTAISDLDGPRQVDVYALINRVGGHDAVLNQARRANITDWRKCAACTEVTPYSTTESVCLICGNR